MISEYLKIYLTRQYSIFPLCLLRSILVRNIAKCNPVKETIDRLFYGGNSKTKF